MSAWTLYAAKPGKTLETVCRDWREVRAQVRRFRPTAWHARRGAHAPRPAITPRWMARTWGLFVRSLDHLRGAR